MAFPIDPGRPPGIQPLDNLVPDQGDVGPRAMLPLAPAREQQHHDVRQHAGLGHGQHDEDMNLEDMLPLRQAFNLDPDDAMLEDDNNQLREHSLRFVDSHFMVLGNFVNCLHNGNDVLINIVIRGSDGHIRLSLTQGFGQREDIIMFCQRGNQFLKC